ncbi:LysR substrate-binding domain-containing protein [Chelativorans salis]|uniref:LysR substrate-binding domain-containing protein n=1 Tax=Chelativorans salis TaxID=2978478 RepID=A0ABT2LX28_9HYPH|nr:LysR substrate-binding domain-containing protein [Chelativorans sp. EGI FJ00035]MCT7378148.1 LysR substrate-binding domain-containing protein [Chelativorans sp. EGI FJ00035]
MSTEIPPHPIGESLATRPVEAFPNLRHLWAFLEVGCLNSMNKAAAVMNLSQPALTQAITRIERAFSEEFFTRHPTGMHPTRAGERALRRIRRAFDALSAALVDLDFAPTAAPRPDLLLTSSQLAALGALVRTTGQEAAARGIGVTPPSLVRNLRGLENRLGRTLLLRDGSQIRLSALGTRLARGACLAERELELLREELDLDRGMTRGRLSVGALPLARPYVAAKPLVTIALRHPAIKVRLVEGAYPPLLEALRNGDIDILLGTLRQPPPFDDVVEHVLADDMLCVVGRTDHPLAGHPAPGVAEFRKYPWIAPRQGSPARQEFDAIFGAGQPSPPQMMEVASHVAVRAILHESDALALVSRRQIRYEEASNQLAVLSTTLAGALRRIGYTLRSDCEPTPVQQEFLAEVAAAVADEG